MLQQVSPEKGMPNFKNIFISNVSGKNIRTFVNCVGSEKSVIDGVTLKDIRVKAGRAGNVRYTNNFQMENVVLETSDGSTINESNNTNFKIR